MKNELMSKVVAPQPGEVWYVQDKHVTLHAEKRVDKSRRPVLVMYHEDCANPGVCVINAIPLSTSSTVDRFTFPIERAYKTIYKSDFKGSKNSVALANFYQPIEYQFFVERIGMIDDSAYGALMNMVCYDVVGFSTQFNLEVA